MMKHYFLQHSSVKSWSSFLITYAFRFCLLQKQMPLGIQNWGLSPVRPTSRSTEPSDIPFQPFIFSDFHHPFSLTFLFLCPVIRSCLWANKGQATHSFELLFLPPNDSVALCKMFTPRNCLCFSAIWTLLLKVS